MATVATTTLIQRTRRFMRDYVPQDAATASISSGGTTLSVADSTIYAKNWTIQLEQEAMLVTALPSGTTLTVTRAVNGTTAASHATSIPILIRPAFLDIEILDGLNYALRQAFPLIYKGVEDTSLTTVSQQYEYTVPTMPSDAQIIPLISTVELKLPGAQDYRTIRGWKVNRGATPKLQFRHEPVPGSTIRIEGYGPFVDLTFAGNTDPLFPPNAAEVLWMGAAEFLTASGEAGRVRVDTGVTDAREQANRVGSSLSLANAMLTRFERACLKHAMPAMPRHVVPTL